MKDTIKNERGITLIALIVTIVVMIVIAGVTINVTVGENGIFTKAKEAKKAQTIAEAKEKIGTEILEAQVEAIERNEELEQTQVEDIISKYGELQTDKDTIILNENGYKISLIEIYGGTTVTTGSYTENKAKIELLENQVKLLEEKNSNLEKQLEDATASDGDKSQKIVELSEQIESLENEREKLKQELAQSESSGNEKNEELNKLKATLNQTTATSNKILKDYKAYSKGELITGAIETKSGSSKAIKVSTGTGGLYQVFSSGFYPAESHFSQANSSEVYSAYSDVASALGITAAKVAKGQTLSGIAGSYTSDATATAAQIILGKTAYVNGSKLTGTHTSQGHTYKMINYVTDNLFGSTSSKDYTYTANVKGKVIISVSAASGGGALSTRWTRSCQLNGKEQTTSGGYVNEWNGYYYYIINVNSGDKVYIKTTVNNNGNYNATAYGIFLVY